MNNPIISWRNSPQKYQYLNKVGKIISLTKIHTATSDFSQNTPYYVALIDFGKNLKIVGQLINETDKAVKINQKVIGIIRRGKNVDKSEIVEYLVKFKVLS